MKPSEKIKKLPDLKKQEVYRLTPEQQSAITGGRRGGNTGTLIPTSAPGKLS